jgi:hypothetical protein
MDALWCCRNASHRCLAIHLLKELAKRENLPSRTYSSRLIYETSQTNSLFSSKNVKTFSFDKLLLFLLNLVRLHLVQGPRLYLSVLNFIDTEISSSRSLPTNIDTNHSSIKYQPNLSKLYHKTALNVCESLS